MAHYAHRIANGGAFVKKQKGTDVPPEDNGIVYDPMKNLNSMRSLRLRSGTRGNNVKS